MFPLQDTVPSRNVPLMNWAIILLNTAVFYFELRLPTAQLQSLLTNLGLVPARMGAGPSAWWTLLTCMFLHGGWLHFIGNMWMLYIFGDNVEDRMGPLRYLIFYLLCGLAADLGQYLVMPDSSQPTIGASGAIAGVLGAYMLLFPTARVVTLVPLIFIPMFFEIPAVVFIGVWFVSQLFSGTLSLVSPQHFAGIAWWAHIGGFMAGMLLLPVFRASPAEYRDFYPDEPWAT